MEVERERGGIDGSRERDRDVTKIVGGRGGRDDGNAVDSYSIPQSCVLMPGNWFC